MLSGTLFGEQTAKIERAEAPLSGDSLHRWNQIAIDASGLDHTPVAEGEDRIFGQQLGPGRAARAMAIVHIAMADAVSALRGGFTSFTGVNARRRETSLEAAICQAAHDTLVAMYSSQTAKFDSLLAEDLVRITDNQVEKANGRNLGRQIATAVVTMRQGDGSATPEPRMGVDYLPGDQAGIWRQDPISQIPLALGGHWGDCVPFVLQTGSQFRPASSAEAGECCLRGGL